MSSSFNFLTKLHRTAILYIALKIIKSTRRNFRENLGELKNRLYLQLEKLF